MFSSRTLRDPDSVVLCVLAIDEEDADDIALQIHFTLLQAFCCDNDVNILRLSGMRRLVQLLDGDAGTEPRDLHCILVTVSLLFTISRVSEPLQIPEPIRVFCRTRRCSRYSVRLCSGSAAFARRVAVGTSGFPVWSCRTAEQNRMRWETSPEKHVCGTENRADHDVWLPDWLIGSTDEREDWEAAVESPHGPKEGPVRPASCSRTGGSGDRRLADGGHVTTHEAATTGQYDQLVTSPP